MKKIREFKKSIKVGSKCAKCGETDIKLLDFSHYSRKDKSVDLRIPHSIAKLKEELTKGRFLCVWCHRLETAEEYKNIVEKNNKEYFRYTKEALDLAIDANAKMCGGPLCKRTMRHSSLFYQDKNGKLSNHCKKCKSVYSRIGRLRAKNYVTRIKLETGQCQECKIPVTEKTICCFDYDHLDMKTKTHTISRMTCGGRRNDSIQKEIDKCRLLCCKCHRIYTWSQLNQVDYELL